MIERGNFAHRCKTLIIHFQYIFKANQHHRNLRVIQMIESMDVFVSANTETHSNEVNFSLHAHLDTELEVIP